MTDETIIVATLEYEGRELMHNDLISAAFHLKSRIEAMEAAGEREGIGLDIMAAVVMTAFAWEAYLNFIGFWLDENFDEGQSGKKKRAKIMAALGIEWDDGQRPFSTILRLIEVRNAMAHGKPYSVKDEWEAIGTHSQLQEQLRTYRAGIETKVDYALLKDAYDDVNELWRTMLKAAKVEIFETLDGGFSGITFKAYADVGEA